MKNNGPIGKSFRNDPGISKIGGRGFAGLTPANPVVNLVN